MITSSSPRLECSSAVSGCRPVAYYMSGILCLFIFMFLTSENPTLWTFVWIVNITLIWLCCNTAISVARIIRVFSVFIVQLYEVDSSDFCTYCGRHMTISVFSLRHVTWSTSTINGNNGEWTNTDDLDHAGRVRMHREAANHRHAVNPGIGNRGRVVYGPPPPDANNVAVPPRDDDDPDVIEAPPPPVDMRLTHVTLYSRGEAYIRSGLLARLWYAFKLVIVGVLFASSYASCLYQFYHTYDPMYTVFIIALTAAWCYYFLRKRASDYFVGSVPGDLTTWGTAEVHLIGNTKVGERTHGYLPGLNYNERFTATASLVFLDTLRRKHPGINCHAEMVNICLNTIQHVHPDEYTAHYQVANDTALYYYQERMRYSVRANRVVVNGRNLLGSA